MPIKKSKLLHFNNLFDNATRGSVKSLDVLATDHNDKLKSNTTNVALVAVYTTVFKPAYDAFKSAYTGLLTAESLYSGRTRNTEALWEDLRKNADEWSFAIEATPGGAFRRGKVSYQTIFPNGYAPLQSGSYEQRMRALKSTVDVATGYADLADVIADMTAFYSTLLYARTEQQGYEFSLAQARTTVDATRDNLVIAMHRVYGFLIYTFAPDTDIVEAYYDISLLRSANRIDNTATANTPTVVDILPLARRTVLNGDYNTTTIFDLANTGNTTLTVWISNNENSSEPINVFTLAAGDSTTIDSDSLSDGSNDLKFLIAANSDAANKGKISVLVV